MSMHAIHAVEVKQAINLRMYVFSCLKYMSIWKTFLQSCSYSSKFKVLVLQQTKSVQNTRFSPTVNSVDGKKDPVNKRMNTSTKMLIG